MNTGKPRHRPQRKFGQVERQVYRPELKSCPYCGAGLHSTGSLYLNKAVQTLVGVVNVRAYGYRCLNRACPRAEQRYRAVKAVLRVSLPYGTYGLDVLAFIGWQRDRRYRQFVEIQQLLHERGIIISERHVGRLYRQSLALVGGATQQLMAQLQASAARHGGVIWALDGLQPDQDGTQLYVLYEILSQRPIAAAWLDKRDSAHLQAWLRPYQQLGLRVLATLSDGEAAEVDALKTLWPDAPHQMCQVHFLGDIAQPIRTADDQLRQAIADHLAGLPPVPSPQPSPPQAASLPLAAPPPALPNLPPLVEPAGSAAEGEPPTLALATGWVAEPEVASAQASQTQLVWVQPACSILALPVNPLFLTEASRGPAENLTPDELRAALARRQALEHRFRHAFQETWRQPSRKPLTFGGLAGYRLLQHLVSALQFYLPKGGQTYLHTLLEWGQEALRQVAPLAHQIQQAKVMLRQIAHLLAAPFQPEPSAPTARPGPTQALVHRPTATAQQLKQRLHQTLTTWAQSPRLKPLAHAFLAETQRLLTKWQSDLFHCYDIPGLPPNNARLEACFNRLRRAQRRISGRKKTAELRRTAHFQVLLHVASPQELWDLLASVPLAAYHQARQRLDAAEEQQRWLYRLRRWPVKTVTAMIDDYLALRRLVQQLSPAGP